jgi:hypothetical protein
MPAGLGNFRDEEGANLSRQLDKLRLRQAIEVAGTTDVLEKTHDMTLAEAARKLVRAPQQGALTAD